MASQLVVNSVVLIVVALGTIVATVIASEDTNHIDLRKSPSFQVYWNVPSFQCASHEIYFSETVKKFGIIQNEDDKFRGNEVVIMYDPGYFPAILEEEGSTNYFYRNGGVPQEGDLKLHMEYFKKHVGEQIPDVNFNGVGVIDFESWRPIFRQNFGTLVPYKTYSVKLERQRHPLWSDAMIKKEATRRFEKFGRIFMEQTLIHVKQLRPNATWGYYAYPYCYNMNSNKQRNCTDEIRKENDRISWLFDISDNYYPSLYMAKELTSEEKIKMIEGRIQEAKRIAMESNNLKTPKILPYFWFRYRNVEEYLSKEDMYNSIMTLKSMGADGMLLWGSSNDVNTKDKCIQLKDYVENVLGPILLTV